MFRSVFVLGHLYGIRIEIHVSWLIIFALILVTMSAGLQHQFPEWPLGVAMGTALTTALLFFSSILAHELGHSLVAIRRGIPVRAITLFLFGGMAQMSRDTTSPEDEFRIAIAGPLVSLGLAASFGLLALLTSGLYEPIPVALAWLALINLVVAVFNMVPGFPLDGGRVFRALVWKWTGDPGKGIRAAVFGGRLVAYGLFALALYNGLVLGNLIGGLWLVLISWFLLFLAQNQGRMYELRERLSGIRARDLADTNPPMVPPETRLDEWLSAYALPAARRSFLVGEAGRPLGLITLSDLKKVGREAWPETRITDVMVPMDQLVTVTPDTGAEELLQLMSEHDLNQIPVIKDGRVQGWIDRQRLLQTIELHMEADSARA